MGFNQSCESVCESPFSGLALNYMCERADNWVLNPQLPVAITTPFFIHSASGKLDVNRQSSANSINPNYGSVYLDV